MNKLKLLLIVLNLKGMNLTDLNSKIGMIGLMLLSSRVLNGLMNIRSFFLRIRSLGMLPHSLLTLTQGLMLMTTVLQS